MDINDKLKELECRECSACSRQQCPDLASTDSCTLTGWQFVAVSLGLFLTPVVLAIVGSILGGADPGDQCVGGILGFLLGMVGTIAIGQWRGREGGRIERDEEELE